MEHGTEIQPYEKPLISFDPIILLRDALRKWYLILVVALIFGMVAYVYTDSGYSPRYTTEATLVLTTRDSDSSVYQKLDSTSTLAAVFSEVLNSSIMRNKILEELQMDSFNGSISASAIESTNLLTVRVTASDPRTAFRVMQVLLQKHEILTYAVMGDIILEVLEQPIVPVAPSNAMNALSTMKQTMGYTAVGVFALLVVLSYFKDVIRSKEEAEQKLDCWCLGEIHHERKKYTLKDRLLRKKHSILITHPDTNFRYVTTMSKLRRRVEQHMHKGKVLMVTSVMENEGKSTVSANLALAMAKKYKRVLLIDCDMLKPAIRRIMNQEQPSFYVNDVLSGRVNLADAVRTDKLSRMDMLFARRYSGQETGDLISSRGLPELLRQAREQYDFVVIDLPPMAIAPDPEAVMEYADASLLVIRQNGVGVADLNRAITALQSGKAKLLGCVLNNVYTTRILSGEGYSTGYGNYGRHGNYGRYGAYASRHTEE